MRQEWQGIKRHAQAYSPDELTARDSHLVAEVRSLITYIGKTSNLILDLESASYYLMDVVLVALPSVQDRFADSRVTAEKVFESPGSAIPPAAQGGRSDHSAVGIRRGSNSS